MHLRSTLASNDAMHFYKLLSPPPAQSRTLESHNATFPKLMIALFLLGLIWMTLAGLELAHATPTTESFLPPQAVADFLDLFKDRLFIIYNNIQITAERVLFACCGICIVMAGVSLVFDSRFDSNVVVSTLIRLLITMGILQFFLQYAYEISSSIVNSVVALYSEQRSADINIGVLFQSFFTLVETFAEILAHQDSFIFMIFLLSLFCFATYVCASFLFCWLSTFTVTVVGSILICFGLLRWTQSWAFNYVRVSLIFGLRLMLISFIFTLGQHIMIDIMDNLQRYIAAGYMIHLQDAGLIIFVMMTLSLLIHHIPQIADQLVPQVPI